MRRSPIKKRSSFLGYLIFFATICSTVTVTLTLFVLINRSTGGDTLTVAISRLIIIVAISAIFTGFDVLRRKVMIDKPVEQILRATDKISQGDFSVRLTPLHVYEKYDDYDVIKENLNALAAELSKSELLKTDFIAGVSHEIKTPLAIIQNYVSLLEKEADEEKRKTYMRAVTSATKRLSDLVGNILKLNKLENQRLNLQYEKIALHDMLAESVVALEEIIEQKGLDVDCDLQDATVYSVRSYLEIVWNNLLSNAVKFTEKGGKVTVRLKKEGGRVKVSVEDTGCGIDAETGKHIFDKFYQGETSHSGEGNGLGLALVKKVIDVIGGEISVASVPGQGSTFTVALQAEDK